MTKYEEQKLIHDNLVNHGIYTIEDVCRKYKIPRKVLRDCIADKSLKYMSPNGGRHKFIQQCDLEEWDRKNNNRFKVIKSEVID